MRNEDRRIDSAIRPAVPIETCFYCAKPANAHAKVNRDRCRVPSKCLPTSWANFTVRSLKAPENQVVRHELEDRFLVHTAVGSVNFLILVLDPQVGQQRGVLTDDLNRRQIVI